MGDVHTIFLIAKLVDNLQISIHHDWFIDNSLSSTFTGKLTIFLLPSRMETPQKGKPQRKNMYPSNAKGDRQRMYMIWIALGTVKEHWCIVRCCLIVCVFSNKNVYNLGWLFVVFLSLLLFVCVSLRIWI